MSITASIWLIILAALVAANLPFINQRLGIVGPVMAGRKPLWVRLLEMIALYLLVGGLGVRYVLVGHSERRQYHGETDAVVAAKAQRALAAGITPIICVGEKLDVRKAGEQVPFVLAQIDAVLAGLTAEQVASLVIAYEPVWAIGTGEVATPEDAQEVCGAIRVRVGALLGAEAAEKVRIQYGGSVKAGNVVAIMAQPDVDGALVGGACLVAEEFAQIVLFYAAA